MQFRQPPAPSVAIESCGEGSITINGKLYTEPVCLGSSVQTGLPEKPQDLALADFQAALNAGAEILLVGTGSRQLFLPPKLAAELSACGASLECMATDAACRTYILLASEGRRVWAWLWPQK